MSQEKMPLGSAHLLNKLLKAISLDTGAAIQQGALGSGNPKLRFYCFTNTECPELLQFFFPETEGMMQLRNTAPDVLARDGGGCDLALVYETLRKRFDAYWTDCMEWVEENLANSEAVQIYYRDEGNLPKSREDLDSKLIKYKRTNRKIKELNAIFSQDPSVHSFMENHEGGTVVLNGVTENRQNQKDVIAAIVAISMIWMAQLGPSGAGRTVFSRLLYTKIRQLFLEDDSNILVGQHFGEIANAPYVDALPGRFQQQNIANTDEAHLDLRIEQITSSVGSAIFDVLFCQIKQEFSEIISVVFQDARSKQYQARLITDEEITKPESMTKLLASREPVSFLEMFHNLDYTRNSEDLSRGDDVKKLTP